MQGYPQATNFNRPISQFNENPDATLIHNNLMSTPLTDAGSPHDQLMDELTMGMENLNSTGNEKRLRAGSKKKA